MRTEAKRFARRIRDNYPSSSELWREGGCGTQPNSRSNASRNGVRTATGARSTYSRALCASFPRLRSHSRASSRRGARPLVSFHLGGAAVHTTPSRPRLLAHCSMEDGTTELSAEGQCPIHLLVRNPSRTLSISTASTMDAARR